jgi:hypothetical protein
LKNRNKTATAEEESKMGGPRIKKNAENIGFEIAATFPALFYCFRTLLTLNPWLSGMHIF